MTKQNTILLISFLIFSSKSIISQTDFYYQLADAALELTKEKVIYDPSFYTMEYPMGDVPPDRGVCTDVIIRAYRKMGIDLQQLVHEDMTAHFHLYPQHWRLTAPEKQIDHRRVPNLMKYFSTHGKVNRITNRGEDYLPGSIIVWNLYGGTNHIGIVSNKKSTDGSRYLIVHNIGAGQVLEDCLFSYKIIGHYRYEKI